MNITEEMNKMRIKRIFLLIITICCLLTNYLSIVSKADNAFEVLYIPVISDKYNNKKPGILKIFCSEDTYYVTLETAVQLIGGTETHSDSDFVVSRDILELKAYSNKEMIMFACRGNSVNMLLNGDLFQALNDNGTWYVDLIGFCYLFGVDFNIVSEKLFSLSEDEICQVMGFSDKTRIDIGELKSCFNFNQYPNYISIHAGMPLSALYQEFKNNIGKYLWNFCDSTEFKNADFCKKIENSLNLGANISEILFNDIRSNALNEFDGFFSYFTTPYESENQYEDSLYKILNINYAEQYAKSNYLSDDNDYESIAQWIQRFQICKGTFDLAKDEGGSVENLKISGKTVENIFNQIDIVGLLASAAQPFCESIEYYDHLDKLPQTQIDMLNYGIIRNSALFDKVETQTELENILQIPTSSVINPGDIGGFVGNEISNEMGFNILEIFGKKRNSDELERIYKNQYDPVFNNPLVTIFLNSVESYHGLYDSSLKIRDNYKDKGQQFFDAADRALKAATNSAAGDVTTALLEKGGSECATVALLIKVFDIGTSVAKDMYGDKLKDSEMLMQCFFISHSLNWTMNITDPNTLHRQMQLTLAASLKACELDGKNLSSADPDLISKMLYQLYNPNNTLTIEFYRKTKPSAIFTATLTSIIAESQVQHSELYRDMDESSTGEYSWKIKPSIRADDISVLYHYQPDLRENPSNEYDYDHYTIGQYLYEDYSPIKINGMWGLIGYDGTMLVTPEYEDIGVGYAEKILASKPSNSNEYYYDYYFLEQTDANNISVLPGDQMCMGTNGVQPLVWVAEDSTIHLYAYKDSLKENRPFAAILGKYDEYKIAVGDDVEDSNGIRKHQYIIVNNGKRVSNEIYEDAGNFSNGIIPVKKDGNWGYVNESGETIIPFEYDDAINMGACRADMALPSACNASGGYVVLCKNSQYALYDVLGNEVIPFGEFKKIRPVYEDLAWVQTDDELWGIIAVGNKKEQFQDNGKNVIGATSAEDLVDFPLDEIISFMDGEYEIGREKLYYNVDNVYIYNYDKYPGLKFAVNSKNNNFSLLSLSENDIKKKIEEGSMYLSFICVVPPGSVNGNFVLSVGMRYSDTINYFGEYSCSLTNSYELIYKIKEMREYLFLDYPESLHGKRDTDTFEFGELYNSNPMINRVIVLPKGYTGPNTPPTPQ